MTKSKKSIQTLIKKRILGIDPGFGRVGIAVLEKENGVDKILHSECFETESRLPYPNRLALIASKIESVIKKWKPTELAIETLLFSKNVKTAMRVAEARGVIIAKAAGKKLEVCEINPNQIKLAVTGYGKADKKQIISMLEIIFKIKKRKKYDDEYDAIAVALASSSMGLSTQLMKE